MDSDLEFIAVFSVLVQLVQHFVCSRPYYEMDDQVAIALVQNLDDAMATSQITLSNVALHDYRVTLNLLTSNSDLRWWVKPRSTMWFVDFLMMEYDRSRWIELFRMSKETFLDIVEHFRPVISRRNTNYRDCVPAEARVACMIYKLVHGCKFMHCSELFAIGKSIVGLVLREVVLAINFVYRNLVSWPGGEKMHSNMLEFRRLCGLPSVHGAIDGTHLK
jgi:hypothetical protein